MKKHSLFTRLFFTFMSLALLLVFSFSISFWLFGDRPFKTIAHKNIGLYVRLLSKEIGTPPNIEMAKKIASENELYVQVKGPDIFFESIPTDLKLSQLKEVKVIGSQSDIRVFKSRKGHFVQLSIGDYKYLYALEFKLKRDLPFVAIGLGLLFCLFWLVVYYHLIKKLFRPLDHIQTAAREYSKGNFDYSLPTSGNAQLVELSKSIKQMALDIQKVLDSKQELITSVAHEFRTPLTRAKLSLEMIEDSSKKESLQEDVDELSKIVSDILEAEKIKSSYQVLDKKEISLSELISEVKTEYFAGVDSIDIKTIENPSIMVDKDKYKLVIKNLLANAVRYGGDKVININISQNAFEIVDQGIGIEQSEIPNLTDAFYRTEKSRAKAHAGIGLGLFLSMKILIAHGHKLEIHSEGLGKGSTFSVRFQ